MARIPFYRGKSIDTGKWIIGQGCLYDDEICERVSIFNDDTGEWEEVHTITVGEGSGLYDRNGKEIFEGDIVRYATMEDKACNIVEFEHGAFGYKCFFGFMSYAGNSNFSFNPLDKSEDHEIIGNIHDNPELAKTIKDFYDENRIP